MQAGAVGSLTVCCINVGDYLSRGAEYVGKLERGIARHLTQPYRFVRLTERELGTDLRGWWVKMKLAEPGRFTGTVLYLDLDVILTANIDHLVDLARTDTSKLWMRDDFSYSLVTPKGSIDPETRRLLGGPGCCNSSVMLWTDDALRPVWDAWAANSAHYMRELHGDQNAITQIMWPDRIGLLPNASIASYKYQIRMNGERPAPIVVTHGEPKPHQIREPWVTEHWS